MNQSSEPLKGKGLPRVSCGLGGINCVTFLKNIKIIYIKADISYLHLISLLSIVEGMMLESNRCQLKVACL